MKRRLLPSQLHLLQSMQPISRSPKWSISMSWRLHFRQVPTSELSKRTVDTRLAETGLPHDLGHCGPCLPQFPYLRNPFRCELRLAAELHALSGADCGALPCPFANRHMPALWLRFCIKFCIGKARDNQDSRPFQRDRPEFELDRRFMEGIG